ncbi:uncharacterized protein LOC124936983 [Impatiens glandulifera]|uniref:uncharacterized protein LOC124936983 n=1 Tax=Impatiens glandulifera TaxID=253017 RepID=UPI001FB14297|nr:uncharacterized protein LOC124936983 [Impatiens glandulifera]
MENATNDNKRSRGDGDSDFPQTKRLKDDLLMINSPKPDLDFLLSSFVEEISVSQTPIESVELHPDLGYLLEASDDELGLPPPVVSGNEESEVIGVSIGEMWMFDEQIPCFDSLEIGIANNNSCADDVTGEYLPFDGLFDYSDAVIESADGL